PDGATGGPMPGGAMPTARCRRARATTRTRIRSETGGPETRVLPGSGRRSRIDASRRGDGGTHADGEVPASSSHRSDANPPRTGRSRNAGAPWALPTFEDGRLAKTRRGYPCRRRGAGELEPPLGRESVPKREVPKRGCFRDPEGGRGERSIRPGG